MTVFQSVKKIIDIQMTVMNVATSVALVAGTVFLYRYRKQIKKHQQLVQERLARGLVYRDPTHRPQKAIKVLELHPDFVAKHPSWKMCSLGEYLGTLRFITDAVDQKDNEGNTMATKDSPVAKALEGQLYVVMASLLMKVFGETMGAAFLPMMKTKKVETVADAFVSRVVAYVMAHILVDSDNLKLWDPIGDRAAMPLNVTEAISFVNLNQKMKEGTEQMSDPPMVWMDRGEIGYNPSFYTPPSEEGEAASQPVLVPNPFVVEEHFERAITGMEDRIRAFQQQDGGQATYDPDDRSHPDPVPVNETLLPDLYLGYGDAKVTHSKREILRNRLFAVLLTKLSYNYERCKLKNNSVEDDLDEDPYFVVRMNGRDCRFPDEFVEALYDSGHSIEVCPRSLITTFGLSACVKEKDGSWTNIPLAFFFRTGYESAKQRPAYFYPLHGGVDLKIEGPLVGTNEKTGESNSCDIQFYMAIDGLCAWHSNHNPDVPWLERAATGPVYTREQTLNAMRMCGLAGCVFNQIGTEMDLPFGGYGLVGVCNDTAALIDCAVRGTTDMYPLLATGRFMMHTARFLMNFHKGIVDYDQRHPDSIFRQKTKEAAGEILKLARAVCTMESDIHCAPDQMIGAARRYQANYPKVYFQIAGDSMDVMKELSEQYATMEKQWADGK